jgi:uncharacterized membrane protein YpjA
MKAFPGSDAPHAEAVSPVSPWERWWALCDRVRSSKLAYALLLVPNLVGIGFGYYYYWDVGQFDPSSAYFRSYGWWPFIPDSPNAVLLCLVALTASVFWGRRSRLLDGLAFTAMLYVGLWTTMLFLSYPDQLQTWQWGGTNNRLFFSHMGMPLEALLFVPALRRDTTPWLLAGGLVAWNLLNLWLDYGPAHLHPAPFLHDPGHLPPATSTQDAFLHAASPWLMAFTLVAYLAFALRGRLRRRALGRTPQP